MISVDNWKVLEQSNKHHIWEKLALRFNCLCSKQGAAAASQPSMNRVIPPAMGSQLKARHPSLRFVWVLSDVRGRPRHPRGTFMLTHPGASPATRQTRSPEVHTPSPSYRGSPDDLFNLLAEVDVVGGRVYGPGHCRVISEGNLIYESVSIAEENQAFRHI